MNVNSSHSARRIFCSLLVLLPLTLSACSVTPCVTRAIGRTAGGGPNDEIGVLGEVGRVGLLIGEVAALPCAIAIDVATFPLTFLWLVWTFGGHGDPPFGCR